jgi:nitrate/nitrite transporter NarK
MPTPIRNSCSPRLGVGIAGGSFAVGVAYVSKWYPQEKAGHGARHFRHAGNVGAAVTKFVAPFVMVAMGWQASRRSGRRAGGHRRAVLPVGEGRSRAGARRAGP